MTEFRAVKSELGELDAEAAAALIAAAGDVTIVLDKQGVIRDLAFGHEDLAREWQRVWVGRRWIDTVTVESRPKIEEMLREAGSVGPPRWRHVNHPVASGGDVPVQYVAMQVGTRGRIVAIGRELRATAMLQQRLVDLQQSLERDYARLRHSEMRYRILFQTTSDAVLIVDAAARRVVEVNPTAVKLIGETAKRLLGQPLVTSCDPQSGPAVEALLNRVLATGRPDSVHARLANDGQEILVAAALFRQENVPFFLVRLAQTDFDGGSAIELKARSMLLRLVENAADAFVVTDTQGRIVTTNLAFLDLAQLASEEQARGEPLERWLGRPGVDLSVLIANLRQHGRVRLFPTLLRGEYGATAEIEISAVALLEGDQPCFGFAIRNIERRPTGEPRPGRQLPHSVEQLTELVGRAPLKDLVRETTDVVERLCIEAALELTGDNRASAAELLGLSRQSLYVKLRRYGLGDLTPDGTE